MDFHPNPDWRSAAEETRTALQRFLNETWEDPRVLMALEGAERELEEAVPNGAPEACQENYQRVQTSPQRLEVKGRALVRISPTAARRMQDWLGVVRHLKRLTRGSGTSLGGSTVTTSQGGPSLGSNVRASEPGPGWQVPEPGLPSSSTNSSSSSPDLRPDGQRDLQRDSVPSDHRPDGQRDLQRDLQSCSCAFQALSIVPSLQPVLLMHPLQGEALREWLLAPAPNGTTEMGHEGSTDHSRDMDNSTPSPALEGGSASGIGSKPGMAVGDPRLLPDGSSLPTKILMYNCSTSGQTVTLDLEDLMDWWGNVWMSVALTSNDYLML